jgi:hypothetical protein
MCHWHIHEPQPGENRHAQLGNGQVVPFAVYDVRHGVEERAKTSLRNRAEAKFVVLLYQFLSKTFAGKLEQRKPATKAPRLARTLSGESIREPTFSARVGIVTPYRQQAVAIRTQFQQFINTSIPKKADRQRAQQDLAQLEIATVDSFQGREKDFVVFSCVRSSRHGGIGFLSQEARLNVALSRAKYGLYVVGNVQTLQRSGKRDQSNCWTQLMQEAVNRMRVRQVPAKVTSKFFS